MNPPDLDSPVSRASRRILFFSEAATLAHVARPMVLAQRLDEEGYQVHFACAPRYQQLFKPLTNPWHPIESISSQGFLDALAKGRPLYSSNQLRAYVTTDLALIEEVAPDLIVGDFRLSLSISARLAGIPYMSITNAYWSPYARPTYIVPELPISQHLPLPLANSLFQLARPLAFALHTRPLNRVRKEFGLPSLGLDLRRTYTDADHTLYADLPDLIPTFHRPDNHHYIGPINWSPSSHLPHWWQQLPDDKPIIYVTLGSSGQSQLLPTVLAGLAGLPVTVIVATAGLIELKSLPTSIFAAEYLPGDQAASISRLVICNGGSPTTMQALAAGVPVIGISSNLDQYLNMAYVEQSGAGVLVRSGQVTAPSLKQIVTKGIENADLLKRAMTLHQQISTNPLNNRFTLLVQRQLNTN